MEVRLNFTLPADAAAGWHAVGADLLTGGKTYTRIYINAQAGSRAAVHAAPCPALPLLCRASEPAP
jgi:hypothetical protein